MTEISGVPAYNPNFGRYERMKNLSVLFFPFSLLSPGRKRLMTENKVASAKKLLASGVLPKDVAKSLGVSVPTLYRWIPASTHA